MPVLILHGGQGSCVAGMQGNALAQTDSDNRSQLPICFPREDLSYVTHTHVRVRAYISGNQIWT